MSRTYSVFDQTALGTSLQLSNSDQVVTTTVPSLSVNRMARCDIAMSAFNGNVEWLVYGSGSITNLVYLGVVDASAVTTKYVGQDTHGYGLKLSDGHLYSNGSSVATIGTIAKNDILSMVYNATDFSLKFYKNGVLLGSYTLPTVGSPAKVSGPWYPAASLGSTAAGDLSVFFNAGQQAFQYPLPGADGWWDTDVDINPVRIASEDFTAPTTDTVPSAIYDGVINPQNPASLSIVRGVSFWPWRSSSASFSGGQSYGSLTIDDPNEDYNALLSLDVRDAPITVARTEAQEFGGSVDSAQVLATGVIDRVDTAGDFQKTIYIKDALAILDAPVQKSLFLPNVDSSAVGKPLPIVAGACRSVPGILIDSTNFIYQFTDAPICQLGGPRVAGKLTVAGVDFNLTTDARSTDYISNPQGKIAADISTVGGSTVGLVDILTSGSPQPLGGQFDTYSSSSDLTANWNLGGYGANVPAWASSGSDPTYPYPRLEMGPQGGAGSGTYLYTKTNVCRAGYSYIAKIEIEHIPAMAIAASTPAYLFVGVQQSYAVSDGLASVYNPFFVDFGTDSYGSPTIELTFTNTTGSNKPFVLGFQSNNVSGTHGVGLAKIKKVYLYELPLATSVTNLTGMNLEDYSRLIIETEGGLSPGTWRSSDAAAIDAATGYTSLGNYISQATTIRNAWQPALDSHCADAVVYRDGTVGVIRLVDPGTITSSGTIGEDVILGPVSAGAVEAGVTVGSTQDSMIAVSPDLAPGLTTKMGARRNWSIYTDGDFGSTSLADCPNATRALLTQQYQALAASGAQLSRSYNYAKQAQPLPSCFDSATEAQTEIDRVCALYTTLRYFYFVPVKSDATDSYEIGQAWQLVYPRYGLSAGKPVLIVGITENPITEQLTLTCWG